MVQGVTTFGAKVALTGRLNFPEIQSDGENDVFDKKSVAYVGIKRRPRG
jgi:hypothetical protein